MIKFRESRVEATFWEPAHRLIGLYLQNPKGGPAKRVFIDGSTNFFGEGYDKWSCVRIKEENYG